MATSPNDAPRSRTLTRLLIVALVLLLAIGGLAFAGYRHLHGLMENISYNARVVTVQPSNSCLAFARDMGGLIDRFAKMAPTIPFDIVFGGGDKPDADHAPDAGPDDQDAADNGDTGPPADPDRPPRADGPAGGPAEGAEEFEGADCNAVVTVEVEFDNPMPLPTLLTIEDVSGSLAGEPVEGEAVTFDPTPQRIEANAAIVQTLKLRFDLGHIVGAAGGLLLRNSIPVEARARVTVSALGGLIERQIHLQVERRLTLAEVINGVAGTVTPGEPP